MTERGDRDGADRGGRRPPSSDDPSGKAAEAGPATPGGGGFSFGRDGFVGHYRIIRELGHGGQGLVYLAEDTRLSRQVALKIMSPEFSRSKGTLARFHREAATASRLDHPGICSIYEAGETDGIHFIAMRYVEGYTLAEMIGEARQVEKAEGRTLAAGTGEATAETPVTPSGVDEGETVTTPSPSVDDATDTAVAPSSGRGAAPADRGASPTRMARLSFETTMPTSRDDIFRVLRIVEHAARALHVAHEAGLIHRDIKPGNIMVDANGDPVLLDFGLAREESEDGGLTISGDLLGTPAYMSPEQIAAHRIALDRRTDNYSLGVTLYECLTLRRPYDAPTRDAIYQKILTADLPDPRRINPHIDRDLRVVLETAMERDRERRYKTALDFAEDLRRIRGFEPIQARPAGPVLRVRRWVQRNPVLATATLGLFLILSTALGITLGLLDEVREESVAKDEALARVKEESEAKEAALTAERAALVLVKKESDAKDAALVAERAALAQVKEESDAKEAALTAERAALARLKEESEAKEEALRRATSLYLTGRAQSVLPVNPKQALLLGLEGAERLPGDLTNDVLLRGLRSDREIHTLDGDGDPVARVAFSPGGRLAATSSPGSRVRVWNVDSGECELLLEPPEYGNVKSLAFSPDSRRIVVATGNGRAYLWNPFSGRLVATLEGHLAGVTVTSASFSSDSSRVVTSSHDGTARVWSAEDGSAVGEPLRGHETGVGTASFSPDGTRVVTGSDGYVHTIELNPSTGQRTSHSMRSKPGATSARIFDVASGRELVKIGDVEGSVRVARFSPDGRFVLTESFRGVQLHDAADGKLLLGSKERYWNPGGSAMFSPDGKYVVGASVSGAVTLWSVDPPEEVRQFSGIDRSSPLMFGPGGKLLVGRTDSDNDILGLWDVESGNRLLTFLGHEENITSLAFHLDGRRLLSGSGDGTARIWDATLGREFGELLEPSERRDANRVYFSGDGSRMVIVRRGGTGEVRATSGGEKISTIANPRTSRSFLGGLLQKQAIAVAFFTPDGERIVGDVGDGTIYFWDRDGKRFVAVRGVPRFIRRVAFSEDGKRLAILGRGKSLAVVRLADGEKLRSWSEVSESVRPLFSPGGDHVLMGVGSALHLRRVDDGEDVWRLAFRELGGTPGFVRFAPGGATLLVAGASYATIFENGSGRKLVDVDDARAVRFAEFDPSGRRLMVVAGTRVGVWDAETGKRLFLLAPGETLVAGALSADGERVTTICRAGVCRVWDSSDGKLLFAVQGHQGPVRSAAFHPGGKKLLTVSADRTCRIWDEDGKELERFEAHTSGVALATWSPDGERAVSVGKDGFAHVWSAATAETIGTLRKASFGGPAGLSSAPFGFGKCLLSRDGRRLLETTYYFGTGTRIWNTDTGQLLLKLPRALSSSQDEHAISPDGRLVHVVNRDRQPFRSGPVLDTYSPPGLAAVRRASVPPGPAVLDVESGTVVCAFAGLGFTPRYARFSLDGRRLVVASGSNVAIWDTTQDRQLARLPAQGSIRQPARLPAQRSIRQLKSADFQPGGNLLFVIDRSGGAFLWEPGSEDEPRDLGGQGRNVLAGQFSADGKLLAMTLSDKTVVVWDVDAGRFVGEPLRGHRQAAEQVVFSPDGRWLATSAGNRRVKVWKVPEGTPWLTVSHPQDVHEIRFLPDSRSLLAYNEQSPRPFLWPLDLPAVARERLNRDLTPAERTRFDVGSPEEREALRRPWEGERLCRELRLATRLVAANPENARAGQLVNRVVRELVAFSRTGAPDEVDASLACAREVLDGLPVEGSVFVEGRVTLQHAVGDLSGAVRTLEFAVAGRPSASLESRLDQYRREALPDLPSFASIDLAVREQTKLIPVGAKWRYLKGTEEPPGEPLAWTRLDFDDAEWQEGRTSIGYGDGDDQTVIGDMRGSYTTVYLRKEFDRPDRERYEDTALVVRVDDGFVAYLNGREIGRARAPGEEGTPVPHDAVATSRVTNWVTDSFPIDPELLVDGRNVLAVQGINYSLTSSDLTLEPVLSALSAGGRPNLEADRRRFAAFRTAAAGDDARERLDYLEACLLERSGRRVDAAPIFRKLWRSNPEFPEPLLGLVRCLRAGGDHRAALAALEKSIDSGLDWSSRVWHAWFQLAVGDLARPPAAVAEYLKEKAPRTSDHAEQLIWALETIEKDGALRINCGSVEDTEDSEGRLWGADRFSWGGTIGRTAYQGEPRSADYPALFQTERFFRPSPDSDLPGYRIPLPPGTYRVILHFAEVHFTTPGRRVFDVVLEGETVLESYEPLAAGYGVVRAHEYTREVKDGFLDVQFRHRAENPKISLIEVLKN